MDSLDTRMHLHSPLLNPPKWAPEGYFPSSCGLQQEDPISPYFFILVMESLSTALDKAVEAKWFNTIEQKSNSKISHLLFVDDILVFGKVSKSLNSLETILSQFGTTTELHMNNEKIKLFVCSRTSKVES